MGKIKVLVVDDQEQITKLVKMGLDKTGNYDVREENNGMNALDTCREFMPDLIFLDVMLPQISGAEIANQILEDADLKHIKIVFLTSIVSKHETEEQGGKIAGRTFLAKPVKLDELINCIEEQLSDSDD